jgi:hypothetical protein
MADAHKRRSAVSPITGKTQQLSVALADPVELRLLHMITGDPQRTPTFVMFGDPDYYFELPSFPPSCAPAAHS